MSSERSRSIVEAAPVRPTADRYDVVVLGGGLAGLTLSIQLKQRRPDTSIVVLEKREGSAPLAAFKVGESTVSSGSHYFAEVIGMREHLENEQLIKCGLRYFPTADGNHDITKRSELGTAGFPPHPDYQIDRGLFENKLAARARGVGVEILQGARVHEVELGGPHHTISFEQYGTEASTTARWVVDASGRASIIKRKLSLGKDSGHHINAAWFRLGGGLDIEDWGREDSSWMGRMSQPGLRMLSTNHLLGEGYWIWMIPLSTGPISIGVCADPRYHPFERINTFDGMLDWLREYEPQLAGAVEARVEDIEDFLRVEDFSYGVERMLSPDRWALVGEAAAFADPFYSPGSDFICFSNTFASEVMVRSLDGEDVAGPLEYYNDLYLRAFEQALARHRDTYPSYGNSWVVCGLVVWYVFSYQTGMTLLTVNDKLTDYEFMRSVDCELDRLFRLNIRMHQMFREWSECESRERPVAFVGPPAFLVDSMRAVVKPYADDDAIRDALRTQVATAEAVAVAMFYSAAQPLPECPPFDKAINPYAVGLNPETWEVDGLFEEPGLTLHEATQTTGSLDLIWADPVASS